MDTRQLPMRRPGCDWQCESPPGPQRVGRWELAGSAELLWDSPAPWAVLHCVSWWPCSQRTLPAALADHSPPELFCCKARPWASESWATQGHGLVREALVSFAQ